MSVLASNLLTLREWSAVVHYNPEIQAARDETLRFIASALIGRFASATTPASSSFATNGQPVGGEGI